MHWDSEARSSCSGAGAGLLLGRNPSSPFASLFTCCPTGGGLLQPLLRCLFLPGQALLIINLFHPSPASPDSSWFPSPVAVGGAVGLCPLFLLCRAETRQVSVRRMCSSAALESWAALAGCCCFVQLHSQSCCFVQLHRLGSATLLEPGESPIACGKLDLS